jgi:hypothetical protein
MFFRVHQQQDSRYYCTYFLLPCTHFYIYADELCEKECLSFGTTTLHTIDDDDIIKSVAVRKEERRKEGRKK